MKHFFILVVFCIPLSVWGQNSYTAAVRFGKGSPNYSPDTAKRESTLYFDMTYQRLFNFKVGLGWEVHQIEYTNGTPSNGIDFRVKFAIDTLASPPKVYTRKNTTWYEISGGGGTSNPNYTYIEISATGQTVNFGATVPATAEIYMNGQLLRPPQYSVINSTTIQINVITVKYDKFTAKF